MNQKIQQEGQEIFDLKPLTKEEVAWLEEHFIDFAREQYLVRWDDMKEAHNVKRNYRDRISAEIAKIRWRIVKLIKMAKIRECAKKQWSGVPIGPR